MFDDPDECLYNSNIIQYSDETRWKNNNITVAQKMIPSGITI